MSMDMSEYQQRAQDTAIYPGSGRAEGLAYVTLGLTSEAGEVAGKIKKLIRDHTGVLSPQRSAAIAEELGDVLWYAAMLADELGADLGQIAELNLAKLESRKSRGVLGGNGDNR